MTGPQGVVGTWAHGVSAGQRVDTNHTDVIHWS